MLPSKPVSGDVFQIFQRMAFGCHVALSEELHIFGSHSKAIVSNLEDDARSINGGNISLFWNTKRRNEIKQTSNVNCSVSTLTMMFVASASMLLAINSSTA